jgi:hypothetical protein
MISRAVRMSLFSRRSLTYLDKTAMPTRQTNALGRALNSLRERRVPWRLRWLKYIQPTNPRLTWQILAAARRDDRDFHCLMLQVFGLRLLGEAVEVAPEVGMRPFIAFGTLLGHRRDGGFIRHDADIDFGILEPDFEKIPRLVAAMQRRGYTVRLNTEREVSFYLPHMPFLLVDFFLFRRKGETIVYHDTRPGVLYEFPWPAEVFEPLVTDMFMQKVPVLVPSQVDTFLQVSYGEWRTPVKNFDNMLGHPNLTVAGEMP